MSRFSKAELKRFRRDIMRKGWEVNGKLTALLSGKNVVMSTVKMPHEQKPGLKPEEKLRLWLDQITRANRRLGTAEFGSCLECGVEFPVGALTDTPWLETCNDCLAEEGEWF